MNDPTHLAHGLAGDETAPDWPALSVAEVTSLLLRYPQLGAPGRIEWHSPRPLSAAALVDCAPGHGVRQASSSQRAQRGHAE